MSFLDLLVENRSGTYLIIKGNSGLFSSEFESNKNIRVLKVYQVSGKDNHMINGVKKFSYDNRRSRIYIETYLDYFTNVKFLIKWCEAK
jgi:hypothetical protein